LWDTLTDQRNLSGKLIVVFTKRDLLPSSMEQKAIDEVIAELQAKFRAENRSSLAVTFLALSVVEAADADTFCATLASVLASA
jgi:hypothetical protein